MTFVGKVLVVVQLVLSVCFMAFAGAVYTYHREWKKEYEVARADLDKANSALNDLQTRSDEREKAARNTLTTHNIDFQPEAEADIVEEAMRKFEEKVRENATRIAENDRLRVDLETEKRLHDDAEALNGVLTKEIELATESQLARRRQADTLRGLNLEARDELLKKEDLLRLTEDVKFNLTRDVDELTNRYNAKIAENARLRTLLLQNEIDPDKLPKSDDAPPPAVEGLVLNTRKAKTGSSELVEISIGSDDGLEMGDRLFVYDRNGGKYLGQITIVHITPDKAVGSVTERAKNGTIEQGHNVSTKL